MPDAISNSEYCHRFYKFLVENTNYFSKEPGNNVINWRNISVWNYRGISGDIVKIHNTKKKERKIVIFPLFNAQYNQYRNWPVRLFEELIHKYNSDMYFDYKKVICTEDNITVEGWETSKDFMANIDHIMTSEIFVGGDTGTSHFVGALVNGPDEIFYYCSGHGLLHGTPFYSLSGKGTLVQYWKDVENQDWNRQ
jgi:ADP-heptose:LPS heptosyltransferase